MAIYTAPTGSGAATFACDGVTDPVGKAGVAINNAGGWDITIPAGYKPKTVTATWDETHVQQGTTVTPDLDSRLTTLFSGEQLVVTIDANYLTAYAAGDNNQPNTESYKTLKSLSVTLEGALTWVNTENQTAGYAESDIEAANLEYYFGATHYSVRPAKHWYTDAVTGTSKKPNELIPGLPINGKKAENCQVTPGYAAAYVPGGTTGLAQPAFVGSLSVDPTNGGIVFYRKAITAATNEGPLKEKEQNSNGATTAEGSKYGEQTIGAGFEVYGNDGSLHVESGADKVLIIKVGNESFTYDASKAEQTSQGGTIVNISTNGSGQAADITLSGASGDALSFSTKGSLSGLSISGLENLIYTGETLSLNNVTVGKDTETVDAANYDLKYYAASDTERTTPLTSIKDAGSYVAVATAKGDAYVGEVERAFEVGKATLTNIKSVELNESNLTYNGTEQKPTVKSITWKDNTAESTAGTKLSADDYSVSYVNSTIVGTAEEGKITPSAPLIVLTAKGSNATGEYQQNYTVAPAALAAEDVKDFPETVAYTGGTAVPDPNTYYLSKFNKTLVQTTDYTIAYKQGEQAVEASGVKAPGEYSIVFTGQGNYTGDVTKTFAVVANLSRATVAAIADQEQNAEPKPEVKLDGTTIDSSELQYTYTDNDKAGRATVTITPKNGSKILTGSVSQFFTVKPASIEGATVTVNGQLTYSGSDQLEAAKGKVAVKVGNDTLSADDYDLVFTKAGQHVTSVTDAGEYKVKAVGKRNYTGVTTAEGTLTVEKADLKDAVIAAIPTEQLDSNSTAITPKPTVTFGGKELVEGTDFTYSYANNGAASSESNKPKVTVTAANDSVNFTGSQDKEFTILAANIQATSLSDATITFDSATAEYTGSNITAPTPTVKITVGEGNEAQETTLTKDTDYTVEWSPATIKDAGTYTCTILGAGTYTGHAEKSFTVTRYDLTKATIASISDITYTGADVAPVPNVTNAAGATAGKGYTVSYMKGNTVVREVIEAGDYTVVVTGDNTNWANSSTASFKVTPVALANNMVTVTPASVTYNGLPAEPESVVVKIGDNVVDPKNYTAVITNNTAPGTATVTVTADEDASVSGSTTATFTIGKASMKSVTVGSIADQTYVEGTPATPKPVVKLGSTTLVENTDYTLSYLDNDAIGTAKVVITGMGDKMDTDSQTVSFKIVSAQQQGGTPGGNAGGSTPDTPATSDTPDSPDTPDAPDTPETPGTSDTPDSPGTPDVPDDPVVDDAVAAELAEVPQGAQDLSIEVKSEETATAVDGTTATTQELEVSYTDENGQEQTKAVTVTALVNADGSPASGWKQVGDDWYYVKRDDGVAEAGKEEVIDGKTYVFEDDATMKTGWHDRTGRGDWTLLNDVSGSGTLGAMKKNTWALKDGAWYYFDSTGAMQVGWVCPKGDGVWYFMANSGAMKTGWIFDGNGWYYLSPVNGVMQRSTTIDGWTVDKHGRWIG